MEDVTSDLDSGDRGIRVRAIRKIAATGPKTADVFSKLFDLALGATGFGERQLARVALYSFSTDMVPLLLQRSRSTQGDHRSLAVDALFGLGGNGYKLGYLLREQVLPPREGKNAAWGELAPDVLARFIELLRDERRDIQLVAASILEECGEALEDVVAVFIVLARDLCSVESMSEEQVADANLIAVHLGRIGAAAVGACESLKHFSHSHNKHLALAARKALEHIGCTD